MAVIGEMSVVAGEGVEPRHPFALSEVEAHGMHVVRGERLGVAFDFAQAERGWRVSGGRLRVLATTSVHAERSRSARPAPRPEHTA